MVFRENPNNASTQRDKAKRILLLVVTAVFVINTLSLGWRLLTVKEPKEIHDKNKQIETITKTVEKTVDNKREITTEKSTKESEGNPSNLVEVLGGLLKNPGKVGIWSFHILVYFITFVLYLFVLITIKGVSDFNFLGFGMKSEQTSITENQMIVNQRTKLDILKHWITLGNQKRYSGSVEDKTLLGYLTVMFEQMQATYHEQFGSFFDVEILTREQIKKSNYPRIIKKSLEAINDVGCGIFIGKEENLPFHKNYLIYKVEGLDEDGTIEYIIVLQSYEYEFDEDDKIVIAALSSIAATVHKLYVQSSAMLEFNEMLVERENEIRVLKETSAGKKQ
ncbi:hypothetical protein [Mesobacillus foraminis]|uniref:hypothetical protein n=1 Tax=Mesobacillus foraminis TaxID=279826 RepID=UPI000EF44BD3|nr:hypothetical protein [Mesobacillus foraminis]